MYLGIPVIMLALVVIVPLSVFTGITIGVHEFTSLSFTLSLLITLIATFIIILLHVLNGPDQVHMDPDAYARIDSYTGVVIQVWSTYAIFPTVYSVLLWSINHFVYDNLMDSVLLAIGITSVLTIMYIGMDQEWRY